jgi:hypothetical protein
MLSCSKERFPCEKDLHGVWIEDIPNTFHQMKLVIDEDKNLFIIDELDSFNYSLDKKKEKIILTSTISNDPTQHSIVFYKKDKKIRIEGFKPTIDEPSITYFNKQ